MATLEHNVCRILNSFSIPARNALLHALSVGVSKRRLLWPVLWRGKVPCELCTVTAMKVLQHRHDRTSQHHNSYIRQPLSLFFEATTPA